MIQPDHDSLTLKQELADKAIIKQLYAHNFINAQGRFFALDLLYPHQRWGYWVSLICRILGTILVLTGAIFFFAYNWEKMTTLYKFSVIEASLVCALFGAWVYSLEKTSGKLLLTSASILVGIFLAVFGQTYQTGADAFQLFVSWSLLIAPWVLLSQFAPLWLIWIVLLNLSLILSWEQMISPSPFDELLSCFLVILNTLFWALREYFHHQQVPWLQQNWQRLILVSVILIVTFIPIEYFIQAHQWEKISTLTMLLCLSVQIGFFIFYRYIRFDRWSFTLTLLSFCLLGISFFWRISDQFNSDSLKLLFMAFITLAIFTWGVSILHKTAQLAKIKNRSLP